VLIDGLDITQKFEQIRKLETTHDADKLFHLINRKRVCLGLKEEAKINLLLGNLQLVERSSIWFSGACTVIINTPSMGTSCNACAKARQQYRKLAQIAEKKKLNR
jgi:hypothetical protein